MYVILYNENSIKRGYKINNELEFKEQLTKIEEKFILKISCWWGRGYAGYKGIIVNEDKELYEYQFYHKTPSKLGELNCNFIRKIKDLTVDEYKMITNFIENEIVGKEFDNYRIFDAGYNLYINYNGTQKAIINNKGIGNDLKIYDKAEKLLKELIGE